MSERKLADTQLTYRAMTPTFTERSPTVIKQNYIELQKDRKSSVDMRPWKTEKRVNSPQPINFAPPALHRKNTPRYVNFTPPKRPF